MTKGGSSVISEQIVEDLWQFDSVKRISQLPLVETSYQFITGAYSSLKAQSRVVSWSLAPAEITFKIAIISTMPTMKLLPLSFVDSIICRGLDTVERTMPAIKYPPQHIVSAGKEYVSSNVIKPVLKRADSVKQMGLNEATRVGEIAATRLDTALDIADNLVDKYLPDTTDVTDSNKKEDSSESKTTHAINHINRLGKKLQRRITKRTLLEAQALKKGGSDVVEALLYLGDLLIHDPHAFSDHMTSAWSHLSGDEPENQIPPANLEQVLTLLARETARKFVHTANFVVAVLPSQTARAFQFSLHHAEIYADFLLKIVHLEGAKNAGISIIIERLEQLKSLVLQILENILSQYQLMTQKPNYLQSTGALVPVIDISLADPNANSALVPTSVLSKPSPLIPDSCPAEPSEAPIPPSQIIELHTTADDKVANGSKNNPSDVTSNNSELTTSSVS